MPDLTICEGFVTEADKNLDINRPLTEFVCMSCGRRFYFDTKKYIKVLKALNIDFSARVP